MGGAVRYEAAEAGGNQSLQGRGSQAVGPETLGDAREPRRAVSGGGAGAALGPGAAGLEEKKKKLGGQRGGGDRAQVREGEA